MLAESFKTDRDKKRRNKGDETEHKGRQAERKGEKNLAVNLLITAVVILICVFLNKLSGRLGIPALLAFILAGMFFGTDGVGKIPFDNYVMAEQICSIALIFIMFYGGFGTKWEAAKPVAVKAGLLSTLGVLFTAGLTGLFCHYVMKIGFLESFLIGAVVGSTDAASVFSILRSKRLSLKYGTDSLLEVESGSNDPCAYMLTAIILRLMEGGIGAGEMVYMVFAQVVYGVVIGTVIALVAARVLERVQFPTEGFDMVFVAAVALLAYALPSAIGGNGYLSVYLAGIILGNTEIPNKKGLVNFFDGITGLMQMLLFFLLGLLSFPSQFPHLIIPALAIALFLTFVARPLAVAVLLTPFGCGLKQQLFISWTGLRGAAAIVFAVMTVNSPAMTENDIFHIVFLIVLFSILVQGSLIPKAARMLDMINADGDVMKTFTDYSDESKIHFIQSVVGENHPWKDKTVREINLPPDTLLALILRENAKLAPSGNTKLRLGDVLILCAMEPDQISGISLVEKQVKQGGKLDGRTIAQVSKDPNTLVILVRRGQENLIPRGNTLLKGGDVLVINQSKQTK